jgi:hypothetical protein
VAVRLASTVVVLLLSAGCAPARLTLPTGQGTPLPDFQSPLHEATVACAGVRTLTGELQLSGRVAGQRLRGRALVGLAEPDRLRLEGLAPFGPPAFILAAREGTSTLLLPRDNRVLRDAPPASVLEALSGARLAPADLMAVLSGCGVPRRDGVRGSTFGEWIVIDLDGGARLYLRRQPASWMVVAALWDNWRLEYGRRDGAFPADVRLVSSAAAAPVELQVRASGIEVNGELGPDAFEVNVPPDAAAIGLDEIRESGPLSGQREGSQP